MERACKGIFKFDFLGIPKFFQGIDFFEKDNFHGLTILTLSLFQEEEHFAISWNVFWDEESFFLSSLDEHFTDLLERLSGERLLEGELEDGQNGDFYPKEFFPSIEGRGDHWDFSVLGGFVHEGASPLANAFLCELPWSPAFEKVFKLSARGLGELDVSPTSESPWKNFNPHKRSAFTSMENALLKGIAPSVENGETLVRLEDFLGKFLENDALQRGFTADLQESQGVDLSPSLSSFLSPSFSSFSAEEDWFLKQRGQWTKNIEGQLEEKRREGEQYSSILRENFRSYDYSQTTVDNRRYEQQTVYHFHGLFSRLLGQKILRQKGENSLWGRGRMLRH